MLSAENNSGFLELGVRERIAALLDRERPSIELLGPFDRLRSPWLERQGRVTQSDDGVCVVRGFAEGAAVVAVGIEAAFEGGSIGEVGGRKFASALRMASASCNAGRPVAGLLLLESGGVRLHEANLGLAAIAEIQHAILELREMAPVVALVAGSVGCFGGMSLAASLCTWIIGTRHGRIGMNGPEVIEQEAGPDELDAGDRQAVWSTFGCEARFRDGWIDALELASSIRLAAAVRTGLRQGLRSPRMDAATRLNRLKTVLAVSTSDFFDKEVTHGAFG